MPHAHMGSCIARGMWRDSRVTVEVGLGRERIIMNIVEP